MEGEMGEKYWEFLLEKAKTTSVMCLQEVRTEGGERSPSLEKVLEDFDCFYLKHSRYGRNSMGLVVAARKELRPEEKEAQALGWFEVDPKKPSYTVAMAQRVSLASGLQVVNFHGVYYPGNKLDTDWRLEQAEKLRDVVSRGGKRVLVLGDFNLEPNTRSLAITGNGMVNLNKKFGVVDTRGPGCFYWGKENYQPYADYGLATSLVDVKEFEVLEVVVSDHKPLRMVIGG